MKDRKLSFWTNRIAILCIVIFFGYNVYHAFITKTSLPDWMILTVVSSFAVVIGSPNESIKVNDKCKIEEPDCK